MTAPGNIRYPDPEVAREILVCTQVKTLGLARLDMEGCP